MSTSVTSVYKFDNDENSCHSKEESGCWSLEHVWSSWFICGSAYNVCSCLFCLFILSFTVTASLGHSCPNILNICQRTDIADAHKVDLDHLEWRGTRICVPRLVCLKITGILPNCNFSGKNNDEPRIPLFRLHQCLILSLASFLFACWDITTCANSALLACSDRILFCSWLRTGIARPGFLWGSFQEMPLLQSQGDTNSPDRSQISLMVQWLKSASVDRSSSVGSPNRATNINQ